MKSSMGRIILWQRLLLAVHIPKGIPNNKAMNEEDRTKANVSIVSFQKPIP
ncbi:hypothetical protein SDC9_93428 [bioreactor metagenome]|uniref:Uncharacterized protein n=1 Tax=bioreactor metagenome TaxID=1076179 RepID=A0A645A110_9ZZZZ